MANVTRITIVNDGFIVRNPR